MNRFRQEIIIVMLLLFGLLYSGSALTARPPTQAPSPRPPLYAISMHSIPHIDKVLFPSTVLAGGAPVSGEVQFKVYGAKINFAEFTFVTATDIKVSTPPDLPKGIDSGSFRFEISTTVAQNAVLELRLVDTRGNRSAPFQFEFTAVKAPCFTVEPKSLKFLMPLFKPPPKSLKSLMALFKPPPIHGSVTITNGAKAPVRWAAEPKATWLSITPNYGTLNSIGLQTVSVEMRASPVIAPPATADIIFSTPDIVGCQQVVHVTLEGPKKTNRPPIASFTVSPSSARPNQVVQFDASKSYDPDGSIVSYRWDFGDGTKPKEDPSAVKVSHPYPKGGTYTVQLTVTDNSGAPSPPSIQTVEVVANAPPVAVFTVAPSSAKPNQVVQFDASKSYDPDGSIVSYRWDFGDGTKPKEDPSAVKVSHPYPKGGTYTVQLTVTDNSGAPSPPSIQTVEVVANAPPVAVFTVAPSSAKPNQVVQFDASKSYGPDGSIVSYRWDFGDGTKPKEDPSAVKVSHPYPKAGTYTVQLTVTDNSGVSSLPSAQEVKVTASKAPQARMELQGEPLGPGKETRFDGSKSSDPGGHIVQYLWNFGDGTREVTTTSGSATHVYSQPGNYGATLVVTDNEGAKGAAKLHVKIPANAPLVASFTVSPSSARPNQVVQFDASKSYDPDGRIVSFRWDFGDGTKTKEIPGAVKVSHPYSKAGTYTVQLTVTDNSGAPSPPSTQTVEVVANAPPVASFTVSPSSARPNQVVRFDASNSYDPAGRIVSFRWDFGDGTPVIRDPEAVRIDHQFSTPGTYTVQLTVTDNSGVSSPPSTQTVEVAANTPPVASFTVSPSSPRPNQAVQFDASASSAPGGRIVSYQWDFGDGTPVIRDPEAVRTDHQFSTPGTFTVQLTVTDNSRAPSPPTTREVTVTVNKPPQPRIELQAGPLKPGKKIRFDGSKSSDPDGQIVSYLWGFGDGTAQLPTTTNSVTHVYSQPGDYEATLQVTDNEGATGPVPARIRVKIQAHAPPIASFTISPSSPRPNQAVRFDASASSAPDGRIVSYQWDFGDGTPINEGQETAKVNHNFSKEGSFSVQLTVTDNSGVASPSITQVVQVTANNPPPGPIKPQTVPMVLIIAGGIGLVALLYFLAHTLLFPPARVDVKITPDPGSPVELIIHVLDPKLPLLSEFIDIRVSQDPGTLRIQVDGPLIEPRKADSDD